MRWFSTPRRTRLADAPSEAQAPAGAPDASLKPCSSRAGWSVGEPAGERSIGLDLVRAIAILLVLVCHVHLMEAAWAKTPVVLWVALGGFMGVQLFFVLSGFLIGRILIGLVAAAATGAADVKAWRSFMLRRWMRTLPLYWIVLAALGLFWPPMFWLPHNGLLLPHLISYATMTQNLLWPMPDSWFSVSWSLAVEEWFYLAFSALLLGLANVVRPGRAIAAVLLLFLLTPPLLRWLVLGDAAWQGSGDHVVPLWFDAPAMGVLAAWALRRVSVGRAASLVLLAAGVLLVLLVWNGGLGLVPSLGRRVRRTFDYDILALGFALCLPASLHLRRLPPVLSLTVRRLSGWSYCLYLTHLSALEIGGFYGRQSGVPPLLIAVGCVVAVFLLSWLSWRYVEAPILALRPPQALRRTVARPSILRPAA